MKAVGRSDIVKRFPASERTGFDFAVLQEGEIGVGESIELVAKNQSSVRVGDITGSLRARSTTSSCSAGQLKSRLCPQLEELFSEATQETHRLARPAVPSQQKMQVGSRANRLSFLAASANKRYIGHERGVNAVKRSH